MSFLSRLHSLPVAHRLQGPRAMTVVNEGRDTVLSLRQHLQVALELELSTLPPYMCALYSIQDGSNVEAAGLIRSVLMEEMLHLLLVANVLNAVGGSPKLTGKEVVPAYPTALPDSDGSFLVSLQKFSPDAIATFQRIELPAAAGSQPQGNHYHTIGQFYAAIEAMIKSSEVKFTHHPKRQISPDDFYNGHGHVIRVHDTESALQALSEITHQGEGVNESIGEDDHPLDAIGYELAHYFRFTEIAEGRRYQKGDTPKSGPTGGFFPIDWSAVKNMITNPQAGWFAPGDPVRRAMDDCNHMFFQMLATLEAAMNGGKQRITDAVPMMIELKQRATGLMNIPSGIADTMLGPSFEWPDAQGG